MNVNFKNLTVEFKENNLDQQKNKCSHFCEDSLKPVPLSIFPSSIIDWHKCFFFK